VRAAERRKSWLAQGSRFLIPMEEQPVANQVQFTACYELLVKPVNSLMPAPLGGPIE
jgi:hypothetical protein